jgi:hypothetical protein
MTEEQQCARPHQVQPHAMIKIRSVFPFVEELSGCEYFVEEELCGCVRTLWRRRSFVVAESTILSLAPPGGASLFGTPFLFFCFSCWLSGWLAIAR